MERMWLAEQLEAGRSIESIAREVRKDPSTVAYWVNKHGLVSGHAQRHAAKGGIDRDTLELLLGEGLTLRAMAARLGVSYTNVRHWMNRHGLQTPRARRLAATASVRAADAEESVVDCPTHGPTRHVRRVEGGMRCLACRQEAVARRRRRVKLTLVEEAGGCCLLCGFDGYPGALQFHHVNPEEKEFALGESGLTRSLARVRREAAKCVLLCANCHAAVEAGLKQLPFRALPEVSPEQPFDGPG